MVGHGVTAGHCSGRRPLQQWPDKLATEISRKKIGAENLGAAIFMRVAAQKLYATAHWLAATSATHATVTALAGTTASCRLAQNRWCKHATFLQGARPRKPMWLYVRQASAMLAYAHADRLKRVLRGAQQPAWPKSKESQCPVANRR